jgi:cytidine deaminase
MSQYPVSPRDFQFPSLQQAARDVAEHAHAPYSRFRVGAALLLDAPEAGFVATGCNVENASFRLTTCAEQAAVASAVARFGPAMRIRAVAIANLNGAACSPCGACRQTLLEFSSPETRIAFPGANGTTIFISLAELLPFAFSFSQA